MGVILNDDWISLQQCCQLLNISRPTLNSYRQKKSLRQVLSKGRILLSKIDIIKKIILMSPPERASSLTIFDNSDFKLIQPIPGILDLRNFKHIDAYGVITLLCAIKCYLKKNENHKIYLILDDSFGCSYLEAIGFFTEVLRGHTSRIFANQEDIVKRVQTRITVILPLHLIGYRGAEKKILDELYDPLLNQGFSETYCGYIGWIIGELCDNAHTHSNGPCYLVIEGVENVSTEKRYLAIALGDIGVGIPESLKTNPKYKLLDDTTLLSMSFQSEISRMEVEPKRGKGLNDVLSIAKGNGSWLRADSNGLGLFFDFREGKDLISFSYPNIDTNGTRFCLLLIDSEFQQIDRKEINVMMQNFMETSS